MIWFGTKDFAMWVPAPSVSNYAAGASNWSSKVTYLNGGANVRRSFGSHREYSMTWNPKKQYLLSPIVDFAQGLHGDGLIYWSDPFAEYTNLLAKDWATPVIGADGRDGVNISGGLRPTIVPTSANSNGFPAQSAQFTGIPATGNRVTTILIPPGKDLIVRAYGSESGGTVRYRFAQKGAAVVDVPWTAVTDLNNSANLRRFSGGVNGSWVDVYLYASATTAVGTVSGVMAQIVDSGAVRPWERFISGQGNSGCRFDGTPVTSPYSAALDLVGMSVNLVEVGAWL